MNQQQEFYKQMVETLKKIQENPLSKQQKIVVESRDHKETVDAAKLQTSMLKLMYAVAVSNWDEGTVAGMRLALFTQEYKNLLERLATVQVTQLSNLIKTVFSTEPDDEDDYGPLNRLMLMYVIPPKFTKGHLNAAFQSNELELAVIYKSTSINPFNYAPQTNQASVLATKKEFDLKRNKKNFSVSETHCKQVSSHIEEIGKNNTMEDVAMTCTNICGVQLAIIDIYLGKPLLYQFAWKLIKFIKNKNFNCWHALNAPSLVHLPMFFMGKLHQFFQNLASFSQNSINTNKVEHGITTSALGLDSKNIAIAVKLGSKFLKKMAEHIKDDTVPKEVPSFARSLFTETSTIPLLLANTNGVVATVPAIAPATESEGGKKKEGKQSRRKKQKREGGPSNKSLQMGLFHTKIGISAGAAHPKKGKLKDEICLDFCSHTRKCSKPHQVCTNGKHYTHWNRIPDEDKALILAHCDSTGKMWLDAETFKKHEIVIPPEFAHLLSDASGPKPKARTSL
jgi:hypothetical protein